MFMSFQKGRTGFRLFSLLLLLAAVTLFCFIPVIPSLVIRDTLSHELMWSRSITADTTFGIRWTHSIHRSLIEEQYRIQSGQIVLSEMSFHDYGIGMENELSPGEELVISDGVFRIRHMNRIFPALHLFIGQVRANHTLLFAGEEIPLGTIDRPGSAITIQTETRSIFSMIGGY
ncbi:DUF1850 domain-containing protein [Brevibacillus centrosporus]|nr:DUF1850 domain-containing protein [Brevibacillus centrosporus]RNB65503.1 DUF1850 domain-containing protein [Brevibacillus centrosporus]